EVHVYHQKGRAAEYVGPGIALDYLEVDGPIHTEWPPPSHRKLFGDIPLVPLRHLPPAKHPERKAFQRPSHIHANNSHRSGEPATVVTNTPAAAAEKALGDFLPRLFRQPVDDATRQRYVRMVLDRLIAGDPFETAMRFALKAALCSPAFLFIADHSTDSNRDARAEFHTKLRLFLTNSAMTKSAIDPRRTRRQQVEDLLREPESERFLVDFLSQWLSLRDIEATTPDPHLYPEYIPYLHDAIRREPAETLRTMLRENRPARDLVAADYVLANQRLAEHYNLPPIQGTDFRKVPLPKNHPHGGFLTMAGIMKVTANGTSTSPVKRGAWVMKSLFGEAPLPPPPDTPAVEPDLKGATTIREQLANHRDHSTCASCHSRFDPPGFALESFDPIGRFRNFYRTTQGAPIPDFVALFPSHLMPDGKFHNAQYHTRFFRGPVVDPSGDWKRGGAFQNVVDFKQQLVQQERKLAQNFLAQLMMYANGKPPQYADRPAMETILNATQPHYGLRSILDTFVESTLFYPSHGNTVP
ncbi:MAG: DUF1588 domain-containing protein, partial [Gemmataceae bacterium]